MRVPNLHIGNAVREIGRNAYVDWIIILVISILIAVSLSVGGLHLYWLISTGNFKGTDVETSNPKKLFDEKSLSKVREIFDQKAAITGRLEKGGEVIPPDPSK